MANFVYNIGKKKLLNGDAPWLGVTMKVMLVTSGYTPDPDHQFVNSGSGAANPSANEVSGTGYTAPGDRKTLGTKTVTEDDTNDQALLNAADVTWASVNGFTARYAIVFYDTGNDSTAPLIALIDFGSGKTANGSDLRLLFGGPVIAATQP